LERFERPFLTVFGDSDPVTKGADKQLQGRVPGAAGQAHLIVAKAGHFLQEDAGEEVAAIVNQFIERTR
jgi:haloalkane dehalogenase